MWLFFLLLTPYLGQGYAHRHRESSDKRCFDRVRYIKCTPASKYQPSVCDCRNAYRCAIKFEVTKVPDHPDTGVDPNDVFRINNGLVGPTIIARSEAIVVVDLFNNIVNAPDDDDTSMHWHGMHQVNVPWMDGVGYVTQWPIPPEGKFRYIFRARPSGTHWYHSHMRSQRDKGLYGALIVRENKRGIHRKLGPFIDIPGRTTLSIREHLEKKTGKDSEPCEPDGSKLPESGVIVDSFQINGHKLSSNIDEENLEPSFNVVPGKNYRFRLIGSMAESVLRVSIDHHKLHVIATDGFLTRPFETDILIVHIGERYDFILKTDEDIEPGTVFPIRIESVAVRCDNFHRPERVGYAYLRYTKGEGNEKALVRKHESRCGGAESCRALNCPFQSYPIGASDVKVDCHDVYDVLRLLYPTAEKDIPATTDTSFQAFFNFDVGNKAATINGIRLELPTTPFVQSNEENPILDECPLRETHECAAKAGEKVCPHTIHIPKKHRMKPIRFIFSSIPANGNKKINSIATHPIHLHGHSFFVSKIAYPTYNAKGQILKVNEDLENPECGPGAWTNNVPPEGIKIDSETIRKDVITVPAGGYVVVEFLADNPGWWFLHCHIDKHLERGMGIVVAELPECETTPPPNMMEQTNSFCYDERTFLEKERHDVCEEDDHNGGEEGEEGRNRLPVWT